MNRMERTIVLFLAATVSWLSQLSVEADDKDRERLLQRADEFFTRDRERAIRDYQWFSENRDKAARLNALQRWALKGFGSAEEGKSYGAANLSHRFERATKASQQLRAYLLAYPNSSRTRIEIRSGRALNWFLAAMGATALEHKLIKERIESAKQRLEELDKQRESIVTTAERESHRQETEAVQHDLEQLRQCQEIINNQIGGRDVLDDYVRERITFRAGESRLKYSMRNSSADSALPLRWPTVIKTNPRYQNICSIIEKAKQVGLDELREKGAVGIATQTQLLAATDGLQRDFDRDYTAFCKRMEANPVKNHQFAQAYSFIRGLRFNVFRFVQAEAIRDVAIEEVFDGRRIEELLAYMSEQGLQFAEADVNAERAYRILYGEMVDYYLALKALEAATLQSEADEESWYKRMQGRLSHLERDIREDIRAIVAPRSGNISGTIGIKWPIGEKPQVGGDITVGGIQ